MIMIIINRSCFSAVVPRPCAADVEPRRCRGEGWDEVTLVNNYPVAGRCQKPINRPSHHSTTLRRPKRLKMNMYAYNYGFFHLKAFFLQRWCMRVCQNAALFLLLSSVYYLVYVCESLFFSSAHYMVIIIIRPLKGVERKKNAREHRHTQPLGPHGSTQVGLLDMINSCCSTI